MDQLDMTAYERVIFGGPWAWFQAMLRLPDGSEVPGIFVRCPVCSSVVDWRDQAGHLRWHGIGSAPTIKRLEQEQRKEWDGLVVL